MIAERRYGTRKFTPTPATRYQAVQLTERRSTTTLEFRETDGAAPDLDMIKMGLDRYMLNLFRMRQAVDDEIRSATLRRDQLTQAVRILP